MASLPELARFQTALDADAVDHLQRLVANWGLLADLCFADLVLWSPTQGAEDRFIVLGHIRPTTAQTIHQSEITGETATATDRPLVARAYHEGVTCAGRRDRPGGPPAGEVAIPVRRAGQVVAVLGRDSIDEIGRVPGELERTYHEIFDRLGHMVAHGDFPYREDTDRLEMVPRVGDGVLLFDADGRVTFTSPNAVSALHRLGVHGQTIGLRLSDLGLGESLLRRCFSGGVPATEEIDRGPDATALIRCLPLLEDGEVTGCVAMIRDISEVRARDRLLLSKDAAIREIHHRVKNNLQTISSLLRLQSRRLESTEAKEAVEESVRRIRSIALVHETLSREGGEDVPFVEIVRPLVRMVEEGYSSLDRPLHFKVRGDAGKLPAAVATPLAVVLTELLQNVVDHAYPDGGEPGEGLVELDTGADQVIVRVTDDGVGLPAGFSPATSAGLGLQIVSTLVESELAGRIDVRPGGGAGDRPGTVVELVVGVGRSLPDGPTASTS